MKALQRGAALLAAMLTVSLVATFAAAALWQQWRSVEIESADRMRVQSSWILTGALDWARLILREDARSGAADYLSEPWALPLKEARLSTFLAADTQHSVDTAATGDADNVFLSGEITDMQAKLNVTSLVEAAVIQDARLEAFRRLFSLFPDTLFYGLEVARLQQRAGQLPETLRTIDAISALPGASEDLGLLELEAVAARATRDYQRERRALSQAVKAAIEADPKAAAKVQAIERERSAEWVAYLTMATAQRDHMLDREDQRGSVFSWGWRPAMSWMLLFLWSWNGVILPVANAIAGTSIVPIPWEHLLGFAGLWLAIYGGGHTIKSVLGR